VHNYTITEDITPADVRIVPVAQLYTYPYPGVYEDDQATWKYTSLKQEKLCLAKNLYFEARNQPIKGQIAVALVTINRVKSSKYPNNICDVVWQHKKNTSGKEVAQFSWTLDGKADIPKDGTAWTEAYELSDTFLSEGSLNNFYDFTNGAMYYHALYVSPDWSKTMIRVVTIGDHAFYNN